ncbi:hypothetical protein GOP47_0007666 [Adiantum capillus-veneris]|uniref:Uncharacterized protein n=1 Tax=Adiantum capillus-veneris TaxID=13818 RepID=A0A9D4ZL55_ADICA|nr:hypothetical protein GOP47_0007666 [Adiantum capillus-veneris]
MGTKTGAVLNACLAMRTASSELWGLSPQCLHQNLPLKTSLQSPFAGKLIIFRSFFGGDDLQFGKPAPDGKPSCKMDRKSGGKSMPNLA